MPRLAIVDNKKIKLMQDKIIIKNKCPVNMTGAKCIEIDDKENLLIDEVLCTGCGICVKFAPNDSIQIINLPDTNKKKIIHQYGENGFRIFDLPIIVQNSITGIIGQNGIGKTTMINILSNNLKANFSNYNQKEEDNDETYFKNLIQNFKGKELQNFFENLRDDKIKVAFKIQQITNIPKFFSGKVMDLLKRIQKDDKKITELSKRLGVENILDRDIKVVSGGELQRIAILSTLLKEDCNFFVFDEITNFLDVYQRIESSKLIKERTENKTTLLIEHDLIILDFLCRYINIMYGKQSAYGMSTNVKPAKLGINEYLEGFSKDENVRFRDHKITFEKDSIFESQRSINFLEWEKDTVKLGDFKLEIKKGNLKSGETLGIIGQNGIGKTTFFNHLTKTLDKKISYKPQLIEITNENVLSSLSQSINFSQNFYDIFVLEPLKIKPLYEKNIDDLSGGELQRFAIAKCLLEDCDIFLFDEPTAFLDVEERLLLSKTIKTFLNQKNKPAIIIDHDLVFMDYISERLMFFDGIPSVNGIANEPKSLKESMNNFLKNIKTTFRRDDLNKRPRINKENSVLDNEQKRKGEYYYV